MHRPVGAFVAAITLAAVTIAPIRTADACRVLELSFTPSADLQIVVWLEDADGQFVDTLFITAATGTYGLGNRPGIMEFNSEFLWPYGRRETIFPVWSHRRGREYPRLIFQDEFDRDLSHSFARSSVDPYFCRPLRSDEPTRQTSVDTGTCATIPYTDKGKFDPQLKSLYPPRNDLVNVQDNIDHADARMFAVLNDLDAVSRATPAGGQPFQHLYKLSSDLPNGEYTVWMEVSKERDMNDDYNYPSPPLVAYGEYGYAYRGQPSVLWTAPITIDQTQRSALTIDYAGYGDAEGIDGNVRAPDDTITSVGDGVGANRLLLAPSAQGMYRFRVDTRPGDDATPPQAPGEASAVALGPTEAEVSFVEPNDASVAGYDMRYAVGQPLTEENIDDIGRPLDVALEHEAPGAPRTVRLTGLFPQTKYWLAIRSRDDCLNHSRPVIFTVVTAAREGGEVSTCFVATAAYGSALHQDVARLRRFRDTALRTNVVGELLVESYYAFGPALAAVIRPSDDLRGLARGALAPIVNSIP